MNLVAWEDIVLPIAKQLNILDAILALRLPRQRSIPTLLAVVSSNLIPWNVVVANLQPLPGSDLIARQTGWWLLPNLPFGLT